MMGRHSTLRQWTAATGMPESPANRVHSPRRSCGPARRAGEGQPDVPCGPQRVVVSLKRADTSSRVPEARLGGLLVAPPLHQAIADIPLLIHGPPQIVPFTIDRAQDLVHVPPLPWPRSPTPGLMGRRLAERAAP